MTKASSQPHSDARSLLAGVAADLPALQRAVEVSARAAAVGFDWERTSDVLAKLDEEQAELREACEIADTGDLGAHALVREELGDLLFAAANLARKQGFDPEEALHAATRKFEARFGFIEAHMREQPGGFGEASLEDMEALWEQAKRVERAALAEPPRPRHPLRSED